MFPTPDLGHLSSEQYDQVYEPAEDSFLLLDSLEKEENFIKSIRPCVCVEIGCGSGVCLTFLAQIIGPHCLYIGTDLNLHATDITRQTVMRNHVNIEIVATNLLAGLSPRLHSCVDVMIFNPPYVVTSPDEVGGCGIEASWAGGDKGRQVIDKLLPTVHKFLSPEGAFYLLIIKENDQADIESIMRSYGFSSEVVLSRRTGPEFLSVLKFTSKECGWINC